MKKNFLLIMMIFIALTGSYKEETKAASNLSLSSSEPTPAAPDLIKNLLDLNAKVDGWAEVTIEYTGNPLPIITIFKERKEVVANNRISLTTKKISSTSGRTIFKINRVIKEDEGIYTVKATNSVGTTEGTFKISVIE